MIRARFKANYEDSRPVKFPPPYPWWESGFACDESHSIVVAFADSEAQILEYWPEAHDIDAQEVSEVAFSDRFPKPEWWNSAPLPETEVKR